MSARREHYKRWCRGVIIKAHRRWEKAEPAWWRLIAHWRWKRQEPQKV